MTVIEIPDEQAALKVAPADASDSAHQRALTITAERAASAIITTDEVLGVSLTFFASAYSAFSP